MSMDEVVIKTELCPPSPSSGAVNMVPTINASATPETSSSKPCPTSSVVLAPTTRPGVFQITGSQLASLAAASAGNLKVTTSTQLEANTLHVLQQSLGITGSAIAASAASSVGGRVITIPSSAAGAATSEEILSKQASPSGSVAVQQTYAIGKRTVVPVQLQQGQTFALRSAAAPKQTLLIPKSGSPVKSGQSAPQMFVPIAVSSGVPTPSSVGIGSVRPIAPRVFASSSSQRQPVASATANQVPSSQLLLSRPQPQLFPKTVTAQQPQTFILPNPAQPGQSNILPGGMMTAPNAGFRQVYRLVTPSGQLVPLNYVQPIAAKANSCVLPQRFNENSEAEPPSSFNGGMQVDAKVLRKPCNCTKSQCLKLYCDCFANGEFCIDCNCNNCFNNLDHEAERSKAIKQCLERNAFAFHPKIGKGKGEAERMHTKGCHCRRSGCLKNYCECYEAKILCSALCKCTGCKNFEESPERKTLMHLADAAEVRVLQQTAAQSKLESQIEQFPSKLWCPADESRLPFSFITSDVAEATADCLLLTAEDSIKRGSSYCETERVIIEEFGRCLMQIIQTANKTKELFAQPP